MTITALEDRTDAVVYASGLTACSACVPKSMSRDEVERQVNTKAPTGLDRGWRISDEPRFKGGEPNPCQCEDGDVEVGHVSDCNEHDRSRDDAGP